MHTESPDEAALRADNAELRVRLEDAEEIARIGVLASCEFDNACEGPVSIYTVRLQLPEFKAGENGFRINGKHRN